MSQAIAGLEIHKPWPRTWKQRWTFHAALSLTFSNCERTASASHIMQHKECDAKSHTLYWWESLTEAACQLVLAILKVALCSTSNH